MDMSNPQSAQLVSVERVYRDGRHNAFPGFTRWHGAYHLAFRNGAGHMGDDAAQIILRSDDGERWHHVYRREHAADPRASHADFRDSYLLPEPERLLLYACETAHGPEGRRTYTLLQTLEPGGEWSEPRIVVPDGVAWKPARLEQGYLAATYKRDPAATAGSQVHALCSADGVHWREVGIIGPGSETVICPQPDASVLALVRTEQPPYHLQIYHAQPPYETWQHVREHAQILQGQEVFALDGRWYLLARHRPDYRATADPQRPSFASHRLRLWRVERSGDLDEMLELPSAGDCGYPGAVVEPDGRVSVAYYSQHETDQADRWSDTAQADLYLARLEIR